MNINWFPGHMVKTRKEIEKNLKLVDIAIEIIDARIPRSSKNPLIDQLLKNKPRLILLNKSDLSSEVENDKWITYFKSKNINAMKINCKKKININNLYKQCKISLEEEFAKRKQKGIINETIKAMVVGIPNSGKSTFINNISNKKSAKIGNRPGITTKTQWIKTNQNLWLLDTPGILWPKFDEYQTALNLSFTHAIKDEILNIEDLTLEFIKHLKHKNPKALKECYGINAEESPIDIYNEIARKLNTLTKKSEIDYLRCANMILQDFRSGKMGRITLETV